MSFGKVGLEVWGGGELSLEEGHLCQIQHPNEDPEVELGDRARRWSDLLVEGHSLKVVFPKIHVLACDKLGYVRDFRSWADTTWVWEVKLKRPVFNWEVQHWDRFRGCLDNFIVQNNVQDTIMWKFVSSSMFTVKYFWQRVGEVQSDSSRHYKNIWRDGSSRGSPGQAGIGGVLRDREGRILCLFSVNMGIRDALTVEIMAIAKAIELCMTKPDVCKKDITLISDSREAVSWINRGGCGNSDHMHSVSDIRSNLIKMDQAHIIFKSRASNSVADSLAKRGSEGGEDRESWSID
ncbi:hypothetical protein Dsin_021211 [Dipteronia sinensis]|uniref:RNase H type-1 domain-containing protein n=1 Tax=Dipteronia sinensis TaxID=43782 RepID=A0AAE0A0Q2_9ROSI|nr:hypothetical protein Dsin_021211 [Dipteronia sinensis]